MKKLIEATYFLHFAIGLNLIAWIISLNLSENIVQIITKAVKAMIKKRISSVVIAKPVYQKVI